MNRPDSLVERARAGLLSTSAPWLAALVFPLHAWASNAQELPTWLDLGVTFAFSFLLAGAGLALSWLCLRDLARASLATVVFLVFFFGYGHAHSLLHSSGFRHRWLFLIWCPAFLVGFWLVARRERQAILKASRLAAVILALLTIQQFASLGVHAWNSSQSDEWVQNSSVLPSTSAVARQSGKGPDRLPDIYFILVDGYARSDMLARYAHFDNTPFHEELEKRGFLIRRQAISNYSQTLMSMPSTLSMEYLDLKRTVPSYALVTNSEVSRILREHGYRYRYVGSACPPLARAPHADYESYLHVFPSSYVWSFAFTTILSLPCALFNVIPVSLDDRRPVIEFGIQELANRPAEPHAIFTLSHLMLPHPPFYYGRNGRLANNDIIGMGLSDPYTDAELRAYVEQVQFLNSQLLAVVDAIDAQSKIPPIVFIQADHGAGFLGMPPNPSPEQLAERMSVFSAVRVPAEMREEFQSSKTSVNQFRIILRRLLGLLLEDLPERSYYSSYSAPNDLVEYLPD